MTRDQYVELVGACDEILLAPDAPAGVTAVPWLHVIREHPVFLARYSAVFQPPSFVADQRERYRQRLAATRQRWRATAPAVSPPAERVDVLFVSHLLNAGGLEASEDFYFGSVPGDLTAAGYPSCVALIDHTAAGEGAKGQPPPGRVALSQRLDARGEQEIGGVLQDASRYLRGSARRASGLRARVRTCASWFALGPEARTALRVARQIEALVGRIRPRLVVTTHEGHAWERLVFAAARRAHPEVRVAGYHATALFSLQHAMTRPLLPDYNPDFVLTAGTVTRDALASRPGLAGVDIAVLGSNRRLEIADFDRSVLRPGCVVVPEGYASEVRILFRFAIAAARLNPAVRWYLRLHPQMSFADVSRDLQDPLPANVILSTRPLADDFADASWALYRGSSAAIQAVAAGLRPLYVKDDEPFTIDPMFNLRDWRVEVSSPGDALARIDEDRAASPEVLATARHAAARYAASYFEPLSADPLARRLAAAP